jgi:hypothetical protein
MAFAVHWEMEKRERKKDGSSERNCGMMWAGKCVALGGKRKAEGGERRSFNQFRLPFRFLRCSAQGWAHPLSLTMWIS